MKVWGMREQGSLSSEACIFGRLRVLNEVAN